jgi:hypothetical protein
MNENGPWSKWQQTLTFLQTRSRYKKLQEPQAQDNDIAANLAWPFPQENQ